MLSKPQILRHFTPVAFFSLLGSLVGVVVETTIAANLGLSASSDTFYVAFTLPYIIANLIHSTGQFSLVPFFTSIKVQEGEKNLWDGFHAILRIVFFGTGLMVLVGMAGSGFLIRIIAPGLEVPQQEQAAQLSLWLFLIIVPAAVGEVIRSFLYSRQRFAVAAAAGFFRNTVVVLVIWTSFRSYGMHSIVLGYLLGYVVQLTVLTAQLLFSFGYRRPGSGFTRGEAFRRLREATGVQLLSAGTWQGLVLVERAVASFLPAGTITALNYGFKILSTLAEVVAGSFGTAVLSSLSQASARKSSKEGQRTFRHTLELIFTLICPLTVFCLLLDQEIIRFIFQRGRFTSAATEIMAQVFFWYSLSLIFYAFLRSLNFYFFARGESWLFYRLFLLQALSAAVFYIVFYLMGFSVISIPLGLLAALALTVLVVIVRNPGNLRSILAALTTRLGLLILPGTVFATLTVGFLRIFLPVPATGFANFVFLLGVCGAGSLVYLFVLGLIRFVHLPLPPNKISP